MSKILGNIDDDSNDKSDFDSEEKKPITFQNFEETNKIAIKHSFLAILIHMNQWTFMYYSVYSSIACNLE